MYIYSCGVSAAEYIKIELELINIKKIEILFKRLKLLTR